MLGNVTYRAVIFDFYGTLTIAATSAERFNGHRDVAAALGVPVEAYAQALRESWPERARGEHGDLRSTLGWVADKCGVEPSADAMDRACTARTREQLRHVRFRSSAVPTLRELKHRGYPVGLVSDCTHEIVDAWSSLDVAPYVDAPVFSVAEGVKKPDPEIYLRACARLGVEPVQCVYVGDGDSRELPGARSLGMRAIRLRADDHDDGHIIEPIEWTGEEVGDLTEVLRLLDVNGGRP
jgi:putative hydrolase of the HAD superfamily